MINFSVLVFLKFYFWLQFWVFFCGGGYRSILTFFPVSALRYCSIVFWVTMFMTRVVFCLFPCMNLFVCILFCTCWAFYIHKFMVLKFEQYGNILDTVFKNTFPSYPHFYFGLYVYVRFVDIVLQITKTLLIFSKLFPFHSSIGRPLNSLICLLKYPTCG